MVVYGSPVPQNWDYGIWTYRVSSQMEEKTGVSVATAVTSADTASTLARLHAEAKQKIFDSISHKAIPGSIKFNLEFENVKEIKSKGDADQFVNSVNTALDSVGAVSAIIPGGQMVALATEIARILGISSFIKSLFGWDDPPTVRAYAVGYTATYKVGFDHVQVVGPGKKDELRARIPIQYVVDGKVYVPYDIKWHQLPYYIAANTGFATYIYDVVEDEETPEYSINVEDMAGIPNISRSENIYYKEVISRDFWTGNTILSDYIPTKGYLFYRLSLYNENVNNLVGALATYFPHYPWDTHLYLPSCIFSCSLRLYSPMPLNTQTLSTGTIYNNIMGNIS